MSATPKPDNPQAFPVPGLSGLPNDNWIDPSEGMSLGDWFAGMAIQGMLAAGIQTASTSVEEDARSAYDYAERMLAEREKRR